MPLLLALKKFLIYYGVYTVEFKQVNAGYFKIWGTPVGYPIGVPIGVPLYSSIWTSF